MTIEPRAFDILEQASGQYRATVVGNDGVTFLPASTLQTMTLTLYVIKTDETIGYVNGRNSQNVLNANNVAVYEALQTAPDGSTYNVLWTIQPGDTTLVEALPFERHIALFEWTWPDGQGKHEIVLVVKNLTEVP